ncbi:MAG: futalosine hydrolase, partial [Phycisphaerales bacterium JB060]
TGQTPAPLPSVPNPAGMALVLVLAARIEAAAVLAGLGTASDAPDDWQPARVTSNVHLLVTGVGKANAAGAVALALGSRSFRAVVNLGICGLLPIARPVAMGETIAASRSIYADEGLELPDGSFIGCASMGFPLGPFDDWGVRADSDLLQILSPLASVTAPVATVSTCSGSDALARTVIERTWAVAEAMEGAAAGQVASRLGVPFLEIRVVSNTTGDRERQVWAIGPALRRVGEVAEGIRRAFEG